MGQRTTRRFRLLPLAPAAAGQRAGNAGSAVSGARSRRPDRRGGPPLTGSLQESLQVLQQTLGESDDIHYVALTLKWQGTPAVLVYLRGLTSKDTLHGSVMRSLRSYEPQGPAPRDLATLAAQLVNVGVVASTQDPANVRDQVYRGQAALLVEGFPGAVVLDTQGWEERSVQSPPSESPLRGPRDGFVENISTNVAQVRRRINDPSLQVRYYQVGARSQTRVAVMYLEDLARPELVHELQTRVAAVQFDGFLDANQLREMLTGRGFNPFPKMESTERPDKVAAALLSGKVAVLMDTTPFVLVAPTTLVDTFWAPDDYYTSPLVTFFVRLVRVVGWAAMVLLPPIYIAVEMYNPDLVRTEMALYLARERAGIPLTAAMEIYVLEIMMEMIFEATVRLPSKVGSAATVVGGVIIGQAAAEARLISGVVIVVAAVSTIGSFTLPGPEMAQVWRTTKWFLILASSIFGIYGLFAAGLALFSWLASQDSFGTPYLAPVAPFLPGDLRRDFISRRPWGALRSRPTTYGPRDRDRTPAPQGRKYLDGGER